ncbi:DoxX family protein [uncultured Caulobacter sp.]|uniref:DoxX family protein n=1 Tax=uncultured Caulobacter sp. TaxID=158749 RepID=UPI00260F84B0|nr:DoxX family protein [uncultured Caulobacter sp.]
MDGSSLVLLDGALLIARLVVGLMFATSGWMKLTRADRRQAMLQSLREGGIPAAEPMARVVPAFELAAGAFLVLGLATGLAALALLTISAVALVTVTAKDVLGEGPWVLRISSLLYAPETLLVALTALLIAAGPGALSFDAALARS